MNGSFDFEALRARLKTEASLLESKERADAAVAVIVDPRRVGGSILLIKRTERDDDPWSGQIAFPGGRRSPRDRTHLENAMREAMEEVGIALREHEVMGILPPIHSKTKRVLVAPFVFRLKSDVSISLNEEAIASFWVPLSDLSKMKPAEHEVRDMGRRLTAPAYVYDDHVIWGLTFRIINKLLSRDQ